MSKVNVEKSTSIKAISSGYVEIVLGVWDFLGAGSLPVDVEFRDGLRKQDEG
jgi:hypothetical protein